MPTTRQQLTEWLFSQPDIRIPVLSAYYQEALLRFPEAAPAYLVPANSARVSQVYTALVACEPPSEFLSETDTTVLICNFLRATWQQLIASPCRLAYSMLLNKSETTASHSSSTVQKKRRPDTMVVVKKCTLLLGEDKHLDLQAALKDLKSKRVDLWKQHYEHVTFLLGYAAAGSQFQWCYLAGVAAQVC